MGNLCGRYESSEDLRYDMAVLTTYTNECTDLKQAKLVNKGNNDKKVQKFVKCNLMSHKGGLLQMPNV